MAQDKETVVENTTNEATSNEKVTPTEAEETAQEIVAQEVEENEDEDAIEFDDSDPAEEEASNQQENKKKQSREKNREYARKRREQQEKDKQTSYYNGVRTALGDTNPFTNEKIETDEDVQTYLDMKEMEKNGLDPTSSSDYIKFIREKQKIEFEQRRIQESVETKKNSEIAEFKAKYPTVDIEKLVDNDPMWNKLIIPQIQQGKTLLEAYDSVNDIIQANINSKAEQLAEEKAKKQVQIQGANVGSLTDGNEPVQSSNVDINSMSKEEFADYWKRKYGG